MEYVFEGVEYPTRRAFCEARRARYAELVEGGMNYTQAAHAVGVSKRTGKVWRNGRSWRSGEAAGRIEGPYLNIGKKEDE